MAALRPAAHRPDSLLRARFGRDLSSPLPSTSAWRSGGPAHGGRPGRCRVAPLSEGGLISPSRRSRLRGIDRLGTDRCARSVEPERVRPATLEPHAPRLTPAEIQPYGCISAARPARLRPPVRRARRSHAARHRPPRHHRRGGRRRAGQPLPDELRRGPEAHRHPRTGRPGHQGARRPPQGRAHQSRAAARRAPPARRVRGVLARTDRPHGRTHCRNERDRPMTVIAVRKDPQALTMTIEAEFDASPERVGRLWAAPRKLGRGWGPPPPPATFTQHDLALGGRTEYYMIG